ncbi:bifunctional phosphoglucose/phosphomannose isomerase [Brumimicrobium aurantiacum]|uniref:Bifunctional phosphoglucose/phosphomannose isomerase n=1 Tax=Brumimicrobium aurantiacum TaxID=1737063 RepID=A0A3E1F1V3_9FLAO|nr:bifunctional phosphoglucose/phosphomannose isomerase [Brumimicrobium aurantiacum]RFC55812.1 bifunctional phosphoglucose/phosphomannose isomerase [Brumimicrobium aurantiacum]
MDKLVAQFPKQIADALEIASRSELSFYKNKTFSNVVICGMGGSGIGGKMVPQLFADQAKLPIVLVQDYQIPSFVNENTLVIGSSYSGNTEETLSAINQANQKGATIVGVSSGGELVKFCKENNYDYIKLPGGNPPRSMMAFSVIQLVNILAKAEIIDANALDAVAKCRHLLNDELMTIKAEAKKLAEHLFNKQAVFYANNDLEFVAIRARQQINENSKRLCWHHVVPEMNHNELVGWAGGDNNFAVTFFISQFISDRNAKRMELSKEIIGKRTENILSINGKGKSKVEEAFYFIHLIDWASLYLAELIGCDPVEVKVIDYLKSTLDKD